MNCLKTFYKKYRYGIPAVMYLMIYLVWFRYLEKTVTNHYQVIHLKLDNYIPFCEVFIIPYLLWFLYVAVIVLYLFFFHKEDFIKCCFFLFTGMTVFLLISTFWPNGHHLRPYSMPRNNIFTQMISVLYATDTSTNIWPSIHVYNSIGAHLAVVHCKKLKKKIWFTIPSLVLCVLIIMSTVLIKQHSLFDVITAFLLASEMYVIVYHKEYSVAAKMMDNRKKNTKPAHV